MKILVTLGTTRFDSLIEFIDNNILNEDYDIIMQIADGIYKPKNFKYFNYTEDIDIYYKESDLIICHAGAGTIYQLLEMKKKLIIVPNLDRIDKHQSDISDFMSKYNYALSIENYNELSKIIEISKDIELIEFTKDPFFKVKEIIDFVVKEF
jgi:beta-1,4-N-acetylglucosaminyltransferase